MNKQKFYKTKYPGVSYRIVGKKGNDRTYYVDITEFGERKWNKIGRASMGINGALANRIRTERLSNVEQRRQGLIPQQQRVMKLDDLAAMFFEKMATKKSTWNKDKERYDRHIRAEFGRSKLSLITKKDITAFISKLESDHSKNGRPYARATIRHYFQVLRRMFNWAVEEELYVGPNPCAFIKFGKLNNKVDEQLSEAEIGRLGEVLNEYENQTVANIIKLALLTGLRKGEIFSLTKQDIEFQKAYVMAERKGRKNKEPVYLNKDAIKVFRNQLAIVENNSSPLVFPSARTGRRINNFRKAWETIKNKAGIDPKFRFHGLRHVFASRLAENGNISMSILQRLMRHESFETTSRYINISEEKCREALESLNYSDLVV